jgi:uncharacterized delta-60 repeat protein
VGRRTLHRGGAAGVIGVALALFVGSVAEANFGDLDPTFGNGGKQTLNFGGTDRPTHLAIAPDGHIVAIGSTSASGAGDYAVARFTSAGTPDASFGSGGKVTLGTAPGVADTGAGVAVLPNEQIVVTGQGNSSQDFVTKRLNPNGSLDSSFGSSGTSVLDFGGTTNRTQWSDRRTARSCSLGPPTRGGPAISRSPD